jgi:hypothetical protein
LSPGVHGVRTRGAILPSYTRSVQIIDGARAMRHSVCRPRRREFVDCSPPVPRSAARQASRPRNIP